MQENDKSPARITPSASQFLQLAALACVWLGWNFFSAARQENSVYAVREAGGAVYYDYQLSVACDEFPKWAIRMDRQNRPEFVYWSGVDDSVAQERQPPRTAWAARLLGVDFVHSIVALDLRTAESAQTVSERNPSLRDIECLRVSHVDATFIRRLPSLRKLERLYLAHATILTDRDAEILSRLRGLRVLHIWGASFSDHALSEIGKIEGLEELLIVGHNDFTDMGLRELSRLSGLRKMWLSTTGKISGAGIRELHLLRSLEFLGIGQARVTEEETAELRRSISSLRRTMW